MRTNLAEYASVLDEADELGIDEFRDRVRDVVVEMAATGQTGMGFPEEYGGGGDIGASIAAFETLAFGDLSVLVKVGVQFGLFGGAILQLGTKRHHDAYLRDLVTGKLMGCFAMTETGHGSNVQALGTVATYDVATQEFVITTHGDEARKDYIGNAAKHAEVAVVFAQLEVGGTSEGVHAFVVPIREGGKVLDGVRIEDDGRKMGLNGVDNGRIWFDERAGAARGAAQPVRRRLAGRRLRELDRQPQPALLHDARHPRAGPGLRRRRRHQRQQGGAHDRDEVRRTPSAVRGRVGHRGAAAPRLRHAPAAAAAADRPHLRAALRAGRRTHASCTTSSPATPDAAREVDPARARGAGGRHQGARHLARDPHHPGVPRGLRRRRLPRGQPVRRAQGRQRHLHDVRGRQPRAAPARGQGAADRLRQRVRGHGPARHGPVRHQPRGRDGDRADLGPQAARAGQGPAARRRRVGPGGRPARLGVPARHAALPRGAHALRGRAPAQARHRPEAATRASSSPRSRTT